MGACASGTASTASTAPSHGIRNASALNAELNHVARNTDDCARAQKLVAAGADLNSTNGGVWRHTPLHQAAYHGRFDMARTLVLLGARLDLPSNPCGRGGRGLPIDLARGGGHHRIVAMLERAQGGGVHGRKVEEDDGLAPVVVEGTDATSTAMSSATRAGDAVALQSAVLAVAGSQPPFRALSRVRTRDGDTALVTCWHRKGGTGSGGWLGCLSYMLTLANGAGHLGQDWIRHGNHCGWTALDCAAQGADTGGQLAAVAALLAAGADSYSSSKVSRTLAPVPRHHHSIIPASHPPTRVWSAAPHPLHRGMRDCQR